MHSPRAWGKPTSPPPHEVRATNIAEKIAEKNIKPAIHFDTPRPPPGRAIPHIDHPSKRATDIDLYMRSPLATSSGETCTASLTQTLYPGGPSPQAFPPPRTLDPISKYFQDNGKKAGAVSTQTSSHPLTFTATPDEQQPAFHILPQALGIWRQSRGCFVTSEKCKVRAEKLRDWAEEGLVVPWAVGTSRTPYHYLPKDQATITHLGEKLTLQALATMKSHAYGIQLEADLKMAQAQALYKSLEAMYVDDPDELLKITQIIARMVAKDHHLATTQANRTEAAMRANPLTPKDVYNLRYPQVSPPTETTNIRGRRRRSQSTSRSPRQQTPRKRQRDNSRDNRRQRDNSRDNRRQRNYVRPQTRHQGTKSADEKLFSRFQQFLRFDKK